MCRTPVASALCYLSGCSANELWAPSRGAACVFNSLLVILFFCGLLYSVVCCCCVPHPCNRVRGSCPFACTVPRRSVSPCNAANRGGWLVRGGQSQARLSSCPPLPGSESRSPEQEHMRGQETGRERRGKEVPPVCMELWSWAPTIIRLRMRGL